MKTLVNAPQAPAAIGPYSHGTGFGDLVFTSGQLGIDASIGKIVEGGISEQSRQALLNLRYVLEAGSADMTTVLKTTCFLADIADFAAFNEVYKEFFQTDCPARSCFAVKDLPMGAKIEIEAIAYKKA